MNPTRIQVKRKKGFRLPSGAIYVGRPTKWGNPFRPGARLTRETMVAKYRSYLMKRADLMAPLPELRGASLACWCRPDQLCHADVLLALANGNRGKARPVRTATGRNRTGESRSPRKKKGPA